MSFPYRSTIARGRFTTDRQSPKGGSQHFRHSKCAHITASEHRAAAVSTFSLGCQPWSYESTPLTLGSSRVSSLTKFESSRESLRLLRFGERWRCFSSRHCFPHNTSDCPKVDRRTSSISHNSSRSSSPAGVVPHSSWTYEEIFADWKIKDQQP